MDENLCCRCKKDLSNGVNIWKNVGDGEVIFKYKPCDCIDNEFEFMRIEEEHPNHIRCHCYDKLGIECRKRKSKIAVRMPIRFKEAMIGMTFSFDTVYNKLECRLDRLESDWDDMINSLKKEWGIIENDATN